MWVLLKRYPFHMLAQVSACLPSKAKGALAPHIADCTLVGWPCAQIMPPHTQRSSMHHTITKHFCIIHLHTHTLHKPIIAHFITMFKLTPLNTYELVLSSPSTHHHLPSSKEHTRFTAGPHQAEPHTDAIHLTIHMQTKPEAH